jgi:hypothetical protein
MFLGLLSFNLPFTEKSPSHAIWQTVIRRDSASGASRL